MKAQKLFDAVTDLPDSLIEEAGAHKFEKRPKKAVWLSAIAAVLVLAFSAGALFSSMKPPRLMPGAYAEEIAAAEYPESVAFPSDAYMGSDEYFVGYKAWNEAFQSNRLAPGEADNLNGMFRASSETFLSAADGENAVFSPLSLYMALCMLAEISGGETREQILTLMGCEDLQSLREQAQRVILSVYQNDGVKTCLPAAAVFLNEYIDFKQTPLGNLAEYFFSSSFRGTMGSSEMNEMLQAWLNENTGGLLGESAREQTLTADTVMALATCVYLSASWENGFNAQKTEQANFNAPGGAVQADYMLKSSMGVYYRGENFSAVFYSFQGGGGMWFFLPDEGVSPAGLLKEDALFRLMESPDTYENAAHIMIHARIPKFDATNKTDLIEGLKSLGITRVFQPSEADFTPLTDVNEVYVSKAEQNARVKIDEEGVLGAAFTIMVMRATGIMMPQEEVEFTLDRPFVFAAVTPDNLPLFMGVINHP